MTNLMNFSDFWKYPTGIIRCQHTPNTSKNTNKVSNRGKLQLTQAQVYGTKAFLLRPPPTYMIDVIKFADQQYFVF